MFFYQIYGQYIRSEIRLFNLPIIDDCNNSAILVSYGTKKEGLVHNTIQLSEGFACVTTDCAEFQIRNGNKITVVPYDSNKDETYYASFVLGWCMAIIMEQRGHCVLHCSFLNINGKGTIVSGVSGAGKSTIANQLIQNGHFYLNDDLAVIDSDGSFSALPGYPIRKMCGNEVVELDKNVIESIDEGRNKFSILDEQHYYNEKLKPSFLFCINKGDVNDLQIEEVTGVAKYFMVLEQLYLALIFHYDTGYPENDKYTCLKLAEQMRIFRITRPSGKDTRTQITSLIEEKTRN